ncbi:MAG: hypothetical protein HY852_19160 [Bradyrhizobium sp.]|uniref:hypothetical protein n=1 Tax=Bradyrhizobium sp. TaxID=376 RepID=UPI0025BC6702|nr:hypothetical protein [Bradyrhizobium sp.]MBI5263932.1 hypothetical protein [Bradyrhizobium sp.]
MSKTAAKICDVFIENMLGAVAVLQFEVALGLRIARNTVIARSAATKQSSFHHHGEILDCFTSLAMTEQMAF